MKTKQINIMDLAELDKHIEELMIYNGLLLELKNDFDKLYGKEKYTDDEVKVLIMNKLLQKILEASLPIVDGEKLKAECDYYKKSCEELLGVIEKDSEATEKIRMKVYNNTECRSDEKGTIT